MNKNIPNVYITLWMVYYLQGVLYQEGGWLSQTLLVVLLMVSLYYFVYANMRFSLPKPMRILSVMVVIWSVYGIIPMMFGTGKLSINVTPFEYIKNIYISLLPIYAIYVFTQKGALREDALRRWVIVFIIVAISGFYKQQLKLMQVNTEDEFTNNAGYFVVSVLPLLPLFWKKPILQYVLMGVCMIYVLRGYKRGAILTGTLCSLWLVYTSFQNEGKIKSGNSRRRITRLILTLFLVVASVVVVQYFMNTSDYFNLRVGTTRHGYTSNRDNLYGFFWSYFINNFSALDYLIGLGANGTLKIYINIAHNDWLEIAIDNGAIMLFIYFIYWMSMLKMFKKGDNRNMSNMMFGMFVIIYLFKSFFSCSYSDIPIYSSIALGYAMATYLPKTSRMTNTVVN